MQNKVLFVLHCCQFFVTLATPKLLSLGKTQINFAPLNFLMTQQRFSKLIFAFAAQKFGFSLAYS